MCKPAAAIQSKTLARLRVPDYDPSPEVNSIRVPVINTEFDKMTFMVVGHIRLDQDNIQETYEELHLIE